MSAAASSRYETIVKLASGGMATVWVGTVRGALGFRQLVAIKRPHPHLLEDASYRHELVTEARLASLIHHANVIDVRDVEVDGDSISLVMDYIEGASLGDLIVAAAKRGELLTPRVAVRIALDALAGMHAAHELIDERGRQVGLVHRDISPQNIVVGVDGLARVADFGVAKFARKNSDSSEGSLKGKLAYMAPEYLRGEAIDRRFDIFALGIVLWESIAGKRLFRGANEAETLRMLLEHEPESLATVVPAAAPIANVVATALARDAGQRFQNALAMAAALESSAIAAGLCGGHTEVALALKDLVGPMIEERRALIRAKLAHEPSLASLMGGIPAVVLDAPATAATVLAGPPSNMPAPLTIVNAPSTVAGDTPRLGGAHDDAPGARTIPLGAAATIAAPLTAVPSAGFAGPQTAVPSTIPMTPRMAGAPVIRTLSSPGPPATPPSTPPSPAPAHDPTGGKAFTLPSAPPARPADLGMAETQLSFNEPSAHTARDFAPEVPRSRLFPVIAAGCGAVVVIAAIAFAATRTRSTSAATGAASTTSAAASLPSAPAGAGSATTTASVPSASSPVAIPPIPSATTVAASPTGRRPSSTKGGAPPALLPGDRAPPRAPAPAETSKKPPPNPYATE